MPEISRGVSQRGEGERVDLQGLLAMLGLHLRVT